MNLSASFLSSLFLVGFAMVNIVGAWAAYRAGNIDETTVRLLFAVVLLQTELLHKTND